MIYLQTAKFCWELCILLPSYANRLPAIFALAMVAVNMDFFYRPPPLSRLWYLLPCFAHYSLWYMEICQSCTYISWNNLAYKTLKCTQTNTKYNCVSRFFLYVCLCWIGADCTKSCFWRFICAKMKKAAQQYSYLGIRLLCMCGVCV